MKKQEFAEKMTEHEKAFNELWSKIVIDTNEFLKENERLSEPIGNIGRIDGFIDSLCLSGSWIEDRLNGFSGLPKTNGYNKSRTKKIRKALGYNL